MKFLRVQICFLLVNVSTVKVIASFAFGGGGGAGGEGGWRSVTWDNFSGRVPQDHEATQGAGGTRKTEKHYRRTEARRFLSISPQSYILHERTHEILVVTQLQNTTGNRELQLYNLAKHFKMLPVFIGMEEGWDLKLLVAWILYIYWNVGRMGPKVLGSMNFIYLLECRKDGTSSRNGHEFDAFIY